MIRQIIDWSARNRWLVLVFSTVAVIGGLWSVNHVPLDAIPDLSDTQVIVYSRWDRSPDIIEDQVTYPIVSAMLGAPKVKAIRGFSDFGFSYVYIVFEDGTDLYWARSRTLEYLSKILPRLPEGVKTELGPDATGVGWVFQYALLDTSGKNSLADLRSFQDWRLRYWLQSVPGVAEVAAFGGFQRQYQVNLDPAKLLAYRIPIAKVVEAVRAGNDDVGGRLVELAGAEYMVRGRGYARSIDDIESIAVAVDERGTPILVRNLGTVSMGPEIRRGIGDLDGLGDTAGGIVIMRHGENALAVIERVKHKLEELRPSLPEGVELVTTYDRSELIVESIDTLRQELLAALLVVTLVILVFLWHLPSAIVPILTIPAAILLAFIPMYLLGVGSNIMSISGITISIGVLVDGAIVEVENAYRRLERWIAGGRVGDFHAVRLSALKEVGPSVFFSLLVIAVAFLPIFVLEEQEGRLFKPLAYTKNLTMAMAALLAITLDPAVRMLFTRMDFVQFRPRWLAWLFNRAAVGRYVPEEQHPISRTLFRLYEGPCRWVIRHRALTIAGSFLLVLTTIPVYRALGSEFKPPLWEGDLLYMPITFPGISVSEARTLLQNTDQVLMSVPEVERVHGKAGRADTSTDPAPFSMLETVVKLKPESQWRAKERFYSDWPAWMKAPLRHVWPDHISKEELHADLQQRLQVPGTTYSMLMPISNRIDMLTTGVRTPIGIKVLGDDLQRIEQVAVEVERILKDVPGTMSAFAERTAGGYFLDFQLERENLARYGLSVDDAQTVLMSAVGGEPVTTTVQGRERYTVNVRYARELRDDLDGLRRVLVPTPSGAQVPLEELAELSLVEGASMIRNENGLLAGYVYVTSSDPDLGGFVERAPGRGPHPAAPPHGVLAGLERPVREHPAHRGAHEGRAADHALPHLRALVHEHEVGGEGRPGHAGGALLGDRRVLAPVAAGLQPLDRGVGRADRPHGPGRGDRRLHAAVPRPLLLGARARRPAEDLRGSDRGHRPRSGQAHPAQADDGQLRVHRTRSDHVVDGHGGRHDEARGGAAHGRPGDELPPGAARLSGSLCGLEMALRDEARHGRRLEARHAEPGRSRVKRSRGLWTWATALLAICGCVAHPAGEQEERDRALEAGRGFDDQLEAAPLPEHPGLEDYLHVAFLANADLRARYWEWRAALERIPQEASPPNAALTFSYLFGGEHLKAWDRTTLGITNDPMTNVPLPGKLAIAGRRALEQARAAGLRFEAAKFRLQAQVLSSYYDLALHAEQLRIQRDRVDWLSVVASESSGRVATGAAPQADMLRSRTELDLARSDLASMHAQLPPMLAQFNALLGRAPDASVPLPEALPEPRPLPAPDDEIIRLAAERSPELDALARRGRSPPGRRGAGTQGPSARRQPLLLDHGLARAGPGRDGRAPDAQGGDRGRDRAGASRAARRAGRSDPVRP
jgi:Cu(I)/Ag(I) efflux system membrane protein CusA/SilA